jgi:hypothetical protein
MSNNDVCQLVANYVIPIVCNAKSVLV